MGGADDSPAPVGDPPTGTAPSHVVKRPFSLPRIVVSVPSGGSPDGTGGSPVLPGNHSNLRYVLARRIPRALPPSLALVWTSRAPEDACRCPAFVYSSWPR